MDTQYVGGPGLVYHHTSPFLDHHSRSFPVIQPGQQSMSWQPQQAHASPPNSSASTSSSLSGTSLYSTVNHSTDNIDYPSSSSAPLSQPRSVHGYPSPIVDESSRPDASFESPQIASSVGPNRFTRRRARTTVQAPSRSYNVCVSYFLSYRPAHASIATRSGVLTPWPLLARALAHPLPFATPFRRRT